MTAYDIDPNQVEPRRLKLAITTSPDAEIITPQLVKDLWRIRIDKMVTKVKEISSSQWAAPVLLTALLAYSIYSGQQQTNQMLEVKREQQTQHDLLIKMQTQKEDQDELMKRDRSDLKDEKEKEATYRENLNNKINALTYSQSQGKNNHAKEN